MDSKPQRNPADLPLVTLDNNVFIALRNDEPAASEVRELLELDRDGLIAINVTVSTAMEAQPKGERLDWQGQTAWLESLGIGRDHIHTHPRSIGFATPDAPDAMTFDPRLEVAFAERIHKILHPEVPARWWEYRDYESEHRHLTDIQKRALLKLDDLRFGPLDILARPTPDLDALSSDEHEELERLLNHLHRKWFNASNDSEGLHIHITLAWHTTYPEHAVFVTSDEDFHKPKKLQALSAIGVRGQILRPAAAVTFLRTVTRMPNSAGIGS
jgi:hypothetical protein